MAVFDDLHEYGVSAGIARPSDLATFVGRFAFGQLATENGGQFHAEFSDLYAAESTGQFEAEMGGQF